MAQFVVRLPNGFTQSFQKDAFKRLFPTCLFTVALEEDSDAKEIAITNPIITPEHLRYLGLITRYGTYTRPPRGLEKEQAGRYLNLPWLEFHDRRCVDENTDNPMEELTPKNALDWAVSCHDVVVAKWAIRQLGENVNNSTEAVTRIVIYGWAEIFEELLRAGLNLQTMPYSHEIASKVFEAYEDYSNEYALLVLLVYAYHHNDKTGGGDYGRIFHGLVERKLIPPDVAINMVPHCPMSLELELLKLIPPDKYIEAFESFTEPEALRFIIERCPNIQSPYELLLLAIEHNWEDYFDDLKAIDDAELDFLADKAALEGSFAIYEKLAPYHSTPRKHAVYMQMHPAEYTANAIVAIGPDPCIIPELLAELVKQCHFPSKGEEAMDHKPLNGDKLIHVWGSELIDKLLTT